MKTKLLYLSIPIALTLSGFLIIQKIETQQPTRRKHNIILQVTQSDSLTQLAVIGQIRNIKNGLPESNIEVVCHARGLEMLMNSKSKVLWQIAELSDQNVVFAACENTMKRKNIQRSDLAPAVQTVPSALVEIILRQEDGWSYVKGGD